MGHMAKKNYHNAHQLFTPHPQTLAIFTCSPRARIRILICFEKVELNIKVSIANKITMPRYEEITS
jgi:hypothetical protein